MTTLTISTMKQKAAKLAAVVTACTWRDAAGNVLRRDHGGRRFGYRFYGIKMRSMIFLPVKISIARAEGEAGDFFCQYADGVTCEARFASWDRMRRYLYHSKQYDEATLIYCGQWLG